MICDRCGEDAELVAYDVLVHLLHNPVPVRPIDIGEPKITCDNTHMRFLLCEDCMKEMGFPNIYTFARTNELKFREVD